MVCVISVAVNVGRFLEFHLIYMDNSVEISRGILTNETLSDNQTKYISSSLLKQRNDTNIAMEGISFDYGHYVSRSFLNTSQVQRQEWQM